MRISIIIFFITFLYSNSSSQKWDIYSNIDSLGNIIKPHNYITEKEIKEKFNVFNFNIKKFSLENMSLLPMQLISNDQIKLTRVPFYEGYLTYMTDLFFIGKIAIKDDKLSHYIFVSVMNEVFKKYYLYNFYSGKLVSVLEICSHSLNGDFEEFSYRLDSEMINSITDIVLSYNFNDNTYDRTIKISIADKGIIKKIE